MCFICTRLCHIRYKRTSILATVEGCDHTWTRITEDHCYKLVTEPKANHEDAINNCAAMGAVLTPVTSQGEHAVIKQMLDDMLVTLI